MINVRARLELAEKAVCLSNTYKLTVSVSDDGPGITKDE